MQDIRLQKLKTSLTDAISQWVEEESVESNWDGLDTYLGDRASELMAESAFNVLLSQSDLYSYLRKENLLKESDQ